jgi:hypothetical protein
MYNHSVRLPIYLTLFLKNGTALKKSGKSNNDPLGKITVENTLIFNTWYCMPKKLMLSSCMSRENPY